MPGSLICWGSLAAFLGGLAFAGEDAPVRPPPVLRPGRFAAFRLLPGERPEAGGWAVSCDGVVARSEGTGPRLLLLAPEEGAPIMVQSGRTTGSAEVETRRVARGGFLVGIVSGAGALLEAVRRDLPPGIGVTPLEPEEIGERWEALEAFDAIVDLDESLLATPAGRAWLRQGGAGLGRRPFREGLGRVDARGEGAAADAIREWARARPAGTPLVRLLERTAASRLSGSPGAQADPWARAGVVLLLGAVAVVFVTRRRGGTGPSRLALVAGIGAAELLVLSRLDLERPGGRVRTITVLVYEGDVDVPAVSVAELASSVGGAVTSEWAGPCGVRALLGRTGGYEVVWTGTTTRLRSDLVRGGARAFLVTHPPGMPPAPPGPPDWQRAVRSGDPPIEPGRPASRLLTALLREGLLGDRSGGVAEGWEGERAFLRVKLSR